MPPLEIHVLLAVEHPLRRRRARARVVIAADIGAGVGLRQRERGDRVAARDRGSQRARCASVPASVIAPLPSPCIANAKSASPSCTRERLARDAQRARIERRQRAAVRGRDA